MKSKISDSTHLYMSDILNSGRLTVCRKLNYLLKEFSSSNAGWHWECGSE